MAARIFRINYKSDFILTMNSEAGWEIPFCIKFWTSIPSRAYFVGYDGETYTHCAYDPSEPTKLMVQFDDHHLPIGNLHFQISYHFTVDDFPNNTEDEVFNEAALTTEIDGETYQVMLDFNGETAPGIDFSLPSVGVTSVNGKVGVVTLTAEDVGAQPTIADLATIRSGAAEGATAVQPAALQEGLATKQNVIEDLATIRSGAAAGATAVQPAALQEGLAGKQDTISDLATIRSGAAAGATAVQPAGLTPIQTALQTIEAVIPSAASSQNQLADKNFVNSSIATNTANFVGTYNSLAELQAVQNPTNNDYGFVIETDAQGNEYYDRYKYVAASQQWLFEYKVESTPFTAAQWAAIQSGITSALVTKLNALPTAQQLTNQLAAKQDTISDLATIRSGAAAGAEAAVRPYNTQSPDGMGYLVLDKEATFASQVTTANTIYEIRYDYDLNGQTITLPAGCVLEFNGGSISNGTLAGKLLSKEPLDFKNFGVKYGNASYAASNAIALNVLSGVTNDITLQVSDEVWLRGSTSINMKSINLEGNGNTIHIDGFSGFAVSDGVTIRNCKVVTEAWSTAKNTFNVFVVVQNVTHPIDVLLDGNYFQGSMRIVSGFDVAEGVTENNEFVSANYNICYNSIIIKNNVFEEICCGNTANFLFRFSDSNVIDVIIANNTIRNFFAEFVDFGITNDSIYESCIQDFYEKIGRSFSVINNQVSNDLEFKPWEKSIIAPAYFCFILAEYGICVFSDNSIINVIGNDANTPTYDAYLSVDVLTFENNIIKNVANLAGAYNEILKSKGGSGQKLRKFVGNRFTLEDLSQEFDVDFTLLPYILVNTSSVIQHYVIERNVINFCTLTLNINNHLQANNLYVQKNVINIGKAVTTANQPVFFPISGECSYAFIEGNVINVGYNTVNQSYLFGAMSSSLARVEIIRNSLINVSLYFTNSDNYNVYGKCANNIYSLDKNAIGGTDTGYLQNGYNSNIVFVDNELTLNNYNVNISVCYNPCPYELKIKSPTYHMLLPAYKINANSRFVVEIKDKNKEIIALSEFLINMADTSTAELTAYDANGVLVNAITSRTNLYNFAGSTGMVQIANRNFILYGLPDVFYLKISMYDDTALKKHPIKGISSKRPTLTASDVGATYFDTTLGKVLYWNGTAWVDATGVPAAESLKVLSISQADYTALATKDNNTLYIVTP